jgi:hypothetical protein
MAAQPNLTKSLVESLKARGIKATTTGKRALAVDNKTIATCYDAKNGVRLFITDARGALPAKLASEFKLNKTRGYARLFKFDDDLTPAVDALAHVASLAPVARKTTAKPSTKSTAKTTRAKSTAKPKSRTRKPSTKRAAAK